MISKKLPIYQTKQRYLSMFRVTTLPKAINSLKNIGGIAETREIIDSLKCYYPNLTSQIKGSLYPQSASEFCRRSSVFFRPESLISELNWVLSYMHGNWENLEWFSCKKREYEHQFMIGNFDNCHKILDDIKTRLGVSLWYYDVKCVLLEFENKSQDSIDFISSTLESCQKNRNYIPSLIYNLYERSSRRLSPYKFDEDLNALYKKNKTDLHEDYYKYVLYRLNYFNQYDNIDLALPIMFEASSSLIDRYLILISAIKTALIQDSKNSSILSKGSYIYNRTKDKALYPILVLKGISLPETFYNQKFIEILDAYYEGDYKKCKNKSEEFIQDESALFDVYIFYCRSLIYLGKPYTRPQSLLEKSPVNEICHKIYNILTYRDAKDNLYELYRINKNLSSFQIASSLDNFVKIESNEFVNNNVKLLGIPYFDPLFTNIWENETDALLYIKKYNRESITCRTWKKRILHELAEDDVLPEHIAGPINVEYYFRKKDFKKAYAACETLYDRAEDCVPIRQTAVARMIDCLYREERIQETINIYLKYYIQDLASVSKVDTNSVIKYLQNNLYEGIRRTIDLVIFVALTCKDTVDKSFVLFEYCEIQSVKLPSKLIEKQKFQQIETSKQELFFSLMNDDETLRHYLNIDSFKDRLAERKRILQYIISLNTQKKELYQIMLKKVDDALLVYNLSRNIDESKIYANDEAIINYKLTEIDGLYSRYRLLVNTVITQGRNLFVVDISGSSFFDNQYGYEEESNTTVSINSNGLYEIFNSLYKEVREQFLNSDYGLVAYLSTRVRHGELETMLRPEMAQRNLILSIRQNSYRNDSYWTENYSLGVQEINIINKALTIFSGQFDNAVTYLIKHKLQIYDKIDKKKGLFNYEVNEKESACKAVEIGLYLKRGNNDKTEFCQLMLKWLWEKTELNLTNIRYYIDNSFTEKITQAIATLETTIKDEMPDGYAKTDMLAEIRAASEAIRLKIQKISRWFNVIQPRLEDIDFKTVSNQIFNSVRLSTTNCKTDSELIITGDSFKIKSTYVIHYADILRNIISNMFDHGINGKNGKRYLDLNIHIASDCINIIFINETNGDENMLNELFAKKINDVKSIFDEGGSGIAKVNKILKQDLNCSQNTISMVVENGKCITKVHINLSNFKAV